MAAVSNKCISATWKQCSALQLYLNNILEYTDVTCMVLVYCKKNILRNTFHSIDLPWQ